MSFIDFIKRLVGCKEDYWTNEYLKVFAELQELLDNQEQPWDEGKKPTWLVEAEPYKPLIEIEGEKIYLKPVDIYMESTTLRSVATKWRSLPLNERMWEAWKFVIVKINYKYDKAENWLPPIVTLERKWGDCEDGTILFVTLCRLAHVPADRVFNACGWYDDGTDRYGHSFPIVKMEDNKWYIMESTLNTIPGSPKLFKDSAYDASWGVANWKFAGLFKEGDQI